MLFCKTVHKGNFVKEVFSGNFTDDSCGADNLNNNLSSGNNFYTQLLLVSEKSLELFNYIYEEDLHIPFLEPIFNQEIFLHILDCKVMRNKNFGSLVILLTTCGLVVLKYSKDKKNFRTVCSELFNLNCEERDKLMYLAVNNELGVVTVYSNTTNIFVYKLFGGIGANDLKLYLLNQNDCLATSYIIDVFILSKDTYPFIKGSNILFSVCAIVKKDDYFDFNLFSFDENFTILNFSIDTSKDTNSGFEFIIPLINTSISKQASNQTELNILNNKSSNAQLNNIPNFDYYRLILSPYNNCLFLIGEKGFTCIKLSPNSDSAIEPIFTKTFSQNSNILTSHIVFENYIQLVFENKVYVFEEDVYNKTVKKVKVVNTGDMARNKKVVRMKKGNYHFLYYDNKMNFSLTTCQFKQDKEKQRMSLIIEEKKVYKDNSFFLLDSALVTKNENAIYTLNGFRGNSKLMRLERALMETRIYSFEYPQARQAYVVSDSSGNNMVFLSVGENTHILRLTNSHQFETIDASESEMNQPTVNVFKYPNEDIFAQITSNSIRLCKFTNEKMQVTSKLDFTNQTIILGSCFYRSGNNTIYFCLYFNTGHLAIYYFDAVNFNFIQDSLFPLPSNISCFDIVLNADKVFLILCTYENRIDVYNYEINSKTFNPSSFLNLTNDENSQIIAESVRVFCDYLLISTRSGEFVLFKLVNTDDGLMIHFMTSYTVPGERDTLVISDIKQSEKEDNSTSISVVLLNSTQIIRLDLCIDNYNVKKTKFKLLIKSENEGFNCFMKNLATQNGTEITLYQVGNKINISNFAKPSNNTLIPDVVKEFEANQLGRRAVNFDDNSFIMLVEDYAEGRVINNSLHIHHHEESKSHLNGCKLLLEEKIKINSLKLFTIEFKENHNQGTTLISYIGLCAQYLSIEENKENSGKGLLIIVQCMRNEMGDLINLKLVRKLGLGIATPTDFCHILENRLIVSCDNIILEIIIELDNANKKLIFASDKKFTFNNKILSLNSVPNSYAFLLGEANESFSLIEFPEKKNLEVHGVDLSMRSLYKAFPINSTSALLLQKTGCFSKFVLKDDIYEVVNSYDTKEFINRCHFIFNINNIYVCTTILGSLLIFYEISDEDLVTKYDVSRDSLINFQNFVINLYSKSIFGQELPLESLRNMTEPMKNTYVIDLIETLHNSNPEIFSELKKEYGETHYDKLITASKFISEEMNNHSI